jgi:hypothetical protein
VSSNNYHKERILNGNLHESWESSGRTGSHWIRIFVKKGFVLRKLYLHVEAKDKAKMPQQVIVSAGQHSKDLTDLSTVRPTLLSSSILIFLFLCELRYIFAFFCCAAGVHPNDFHWRI